MESHPSQILYKWGSRAISAALAARFERDMPYIFIKAALLASPAEEFLAKGYRF
jgi:hypothetical protein